MVYYDVTRGTGVIPHQLVSFRIEPVEGTGVRAGSRNSASGVYPGMGTLEEQVECLPWRPTTPSLSS